MNDQFGYKAFANAEILDAIARIDQGAHPAQWTQAVRLMNHTCVVDRIFAAHLDGGRHPFGDTNTPETPTLAQLRADISASDAWYRQYVARLDDDALRERIRFTFTDGDGGAMTRAEMLFHVLAHGTYHRGNVGMLLAACGVERPRDTFTRFLHLQEPGRRAAAGEAA